MRKATLILSVIIVLCLLLPGCAAAEPGLEIDGNLGAFASISLTEAHIESLLHSLEMMTMTDEVKSANWDRMSPMVSKFAQDQIPAVVWFALPDGSYFTVDLGKTDKNIGDRAYFAKAISGEKSLGELLVSKTTGEKVVVTAVPVKIDGKVIGILGASAYLEKLSEIIINEMQLTDDMVLYAVNDQGILALHTNPQWILRDVADLGSESYIKAIKDMVSKKEGFVAYKIGKTSERVVYKTSSLMGWHFALGFKNK
ncbi:cache domain-containing protein [Chloroflexota bacterium]